MNYLGQIINTTSGSANAYASYQLHPQVGSPAVLDDDGPHDEPTAWLRAQVREITELAAA